MPKETHLARHTQRAYNLRPTRCLARHSHGAIQYFKRSRIYSVSCEITGMYLEALMSRLECIWFSLVRV